MRTLSAVKIPASLHRGRVVYRRVHQLNEQLESRTWSLRDWFSRGLVSIWGVVPSNIQLLQYVLR